MKDELALQHHLLFHTSVSNLKESGLGLKNQITPPHQKKKKRNTRGVILFRGLFPAASLGQAGLRRSMAGYLSP